MDEVVTILRNVARNGRGGLARQLDPKAVIEFPAVPVLVIRADEIREVGGLRAVAMHITERGREQVAAKVRRHVPPRLVLRQPAQPRPFQPLQQTVVGGAIPFGQS